MVKTQEQINNEVEHSNRSSSHNNRISGGYPGLMYNNGGGSPSHFSNSGGDSPSHFSQQSSPYLQQSSPYPQDTSETDQFSADTDLLAAQNLMYDYPPPVEALGETQNDSNHSVSSQASDDMPLTTVHGLDIDLTASHRSADDTRYAEADSFQTTSSLPPNQYFSQHHFDLANENDDDDEHLLPTTASVNSNNTYTIRYLQNRSRTLLAIGIFFVVLGATLTAGSYYLDLHVFFVFWGLIVVGLITAIRGFILRRQICQIREEAALWTGQAQHHFVFHDDYYDQQEQQQSDESFDSSQSNSGSEESVN